MSPVHHKSILDYLAETACRFVETLPYLNRNESKWSSFRWTSCQYMHACLWQRVKDTDEWSGRNGTNCSDWDRLLCVSQVTRTVRTSHDPCTTTTTMIVPSHTVPRKTRHLIFIIAWTNQPRFFDTQSIVYDDDFWWWHCLWSYVIQCLNANGLATSQTDGRTDDMRSQDRALHCSASRGKSFARSYRWQTGRRCREVRRRSRWCRRWCLLYCDHLARRCQSCHRSSSSEIQSSLQQTVNSKQLPRSVTRHKSDERISDGLANEDQGRDISFVKVQVCYSIQHFISISDLWWR